MKMLRSQCCEMRLFEVIFKNFDEMIFCRAGSKKHFGRLNIYGPPTARNFPRDLKAIEGQSFLLSCPMGGFPLEGVSWEKEGVELNNDGSDLRRKVFKSNGTLLLKKVVKEADEGGYICTAKSRNGRQTASASTLLRVIGKHLQKTLPAVSIISDVIKEVD